MSVLTDSQTKDFPTFAADEGGGILRGDFKLIQAIAESAGVASFPAAAGALPEPPALVVVNPAVGAQGALTLAAFTDGQAPKTAPMIGPAYHGPRSLALSAPADNPDTIYYSQSAAVRPLGAVTDFETANPIVNPEFTGNLNGWTEGTSSESNNYWSYNAGTGDAQWEADVIGDDAAELSQIISDLPPGTYVIEANISTVSSTDGVVTVLLVANDNQLIGINAAGTLSEIYNHPGGDCDLRIRIEVTGETDNPVTVEIGSVTMNIPYVAAPHVGIPLAPGETHLLTSRDRDLTRPFYAVQPIGAAANDNTIIANYGN